MADRAQILITAVDQTRTAFASVKASLEGLSRSAQKVNGMLASLGVAASSLSLGAVVKALIDSADAAAKLSQRVGIAVEQVSLLSKAAELSGASMQVFEGGLRKLAAAMTSAAGGSKAAADAFAALGVSVKDGAKLRAVDEVLLDLADRFKAMPDGAEKSALAMQIFGESGARLLPFLNQGRDGIEGLTAELKDLGAQIGGTTAAQAEAFNDALSKLTIAVSGVGNRLIEALLPGLVHMANAMVESAKRGGTLHAVLGAIVKVVKTLALGAATLGNAFVALGEAIGAGVAAAVEALKGNVSNAKVIIGELKGALVRRLDELAAFRDSLFEPKPIEVKAPQVKTQPLTLSAPAIEKPKPAGADLALVKARLDAELALLKDGLARQKAALDAALEDRLVSVRDYYAQKTAIEQREIDAEIARAQQLLAEQRRIAKTGSESERQRALGEIARLEAELIRLNNRRADVAQANARAVARAERELADALAQAREELAQITGTATAEDRRAAIERSYRDLRARLAAEGDTEGVSLIDRLIDVKAAQANLNALEAQWRQAQERMRISQDAAKIAFEAGLITQSEYQARIAQSSQEAASALDALIPKMQQAAAAIGPEASLRVAEFKNRLKELQNVADPVAQLINTDVKNAFVSMFESIVSGAKTAKDAFCDFARSVVASLQRIAAQRFAEQIFASFGGGRGTGGSSAIKGFASGGYVTGPGTSTSDSIPARLSAGEYVVRAEAVRRVGVAFLDAINGLRMPPSIIGGRLAFAAGGLVPDVHVQPQVNQAVRIVNVIDPSLAADYLTSPAGEKTVLNILRRNADAVRVVLG